MRLSVTTNRPEGEAPGEKCPPGRYNAVLAYVYDVGLQTNKFATADPKTGRMPSDKHQAVLVWEVDKRDAQGRRHVMYEPVTYSGNEKSNLYARYIALMGKPPTGSFDTEELVGRVAEVKVVAAQDPTRFPKLGYVEEPRDAVTLTIEGRYSEDTPPRFVQTMRDRATGLQSWLGASGATQTRAARPAASQRAALPSQAVDADANDGPDGNPLPF